ncbi:MAG: hypothetical protein GY694_19075 [Gammaproteobacteria bacterium]|nr:hypothetical protein [Gammaproteobacteria bacterium]
MKVLGSIAFLAAMTSAVDLIFVKLHQNKYGPYYENIAYIDTFEAGCRRSDRDIRDVQASYELIVSIDDLLVKTHKPFIGLYPLRICFFDNFFALYDSKKLNNLAPGDKVKVLVDKNNNVYLGKTQDVINYAIITFSTLYFLFVLVRRYRSAKNRDSILNSSETNL